MRFFFFGTLMDRDVLDAVVGQASAGQLAIGQPAIGQQTAGQQTAVHGRRPAWLDGFRRMTVAREAFPMVLPAPGHRLEGVVVEGLSAADIDRILFFESIEYAPRTIDVALADDSRLSARCFLTNDGVEYNGETWDYGQWLNAHKADCLRETRLWMALYGHVDCQAADRLWDEALAAGRPLEEMVAEVRARRDEGDALLAQPSLTGSSLAKSTA